MAKVDKTDVAVIPCRIAKSTASEELCGKMPHAIVDGKVVANVGSIVYAWRLRSGYKPAWYRCKVIRSAEKWLELWDEVAEQWYCFDPTSAPPDVRFDGQNI